MTLYEFNALAETAKAEVTWSKGVFLAGREGVNYTAALYQIDSFYIEVIYNSDQNEIVKFRSFLSTVPLEPYLRQIDITPLVS
jgi:hypothetical protein